MKKGILFSLVFLSVIFSWSLGPNIKQAKAITSVFLFSPSDSIKMRTVTPTFIWGYNSDPGGKEIIRKYQIVVARNFELTDRVWDDSTILFPSNSVVYNGSPFQEWTTYFWSVRVQVDSLRFTGTRTDTIFVGWYKFVKPFTFFYSTATLIEIPDSLHNLRTIQTGIIWAAEGDTVLVKPGVYYENLRFNKKGVVLASHFIRNDTAAIRTTMLDGDSLTRGENNGSVVYFTADADSNSKVIGFTIRNGKGTKISIGIQEKINGGGIFCAPGSTPTIARNVITQNHARDDGGGIYIYSAAPNIFENIITQNSAGGSGGAIECYYSIRTSPPASLSSPRGEGVEDGGIEIMPMSNPAPKSTEANSSIDKSDLKNSLYPRDATEVFSALSSEANNPPVPVIDYYPKKSKYLVGDTIWLDASASYDPDSLAGDSISQYIWEGRRYNDCKNPSTARTISLPRGKIITYVITQTNGGRCQFRITVIDTHNGQKLSDYTPSLNVQNPPTADAGKDIVTSPGDTARLDGSGSCDINTDDATTLSFLWTRISGPDSVTIVHPESAKAYFLSEERHGGIHSFRLKVSDSDTFSMDTVKVTVDRPPTAVTLDSLAGFPAVIETTIIRQDTTGGVHSDTIDTTIAANLPLDASLSFDPDSPLDSVKYFIWKGISHTTCEATKPLSISTDSTKKLQYFPANEGGGIYKVSLYVRDKYGVISKNTDTLVISAELRPKANAGPDMIVIRGTYLSLHGSACEVNWDQVNSLKYEWGQPKTNPANVTFRPNEQSQNVTFQASPDSNHGGVYRFALRVTDSFGESSRPDDTVKIIVNALPQIDSLAPDTNIVTFGEGDSVELAAPAHDPDAQRFGDSLIFSWTALSWPEFPKTTYQPAIINPNKPIAKFVPLKHGRYKFRIVVHDTISIQHPDTVRGINIQTVWVKVDTTIAYPFIMGNLIWSNTAGSKGGGIDCFQSSPKIVNNIFYGNKSGSSGGAICSRASSAPYIERNIFLGNISGDSTGGAIANLKAELSPSAYWGFRNKIEIARNDFWNNAGKNFYQPPDTSNNVYSYPRLLDPEYGDFGLECTSPCKKDSIGLLLWLYPDTCDTVPPLHMISLSLFQNPVATAVANFLVNTDVPLKAPPVAYVTIGEYSPAPVSFTNISSTTYLGNFVFSTSGTANISVFVSSVQEKDTSMVRAFSVQLIQAGKLGKLVSPDNRLTVLFPQETVKDEIYATCIPVSDDPQYSFQNEDKIALGEAYYLGPVFDFKKELTIGFPLDNYDLTQKDKSLFSIYGYEKNHWEKQASFLDGNSVCAKVGKLGVYRLVYDAKQEHITGIPRTYQLSQNYPNPFNPETMIKYDLPEPGHVNITVYNILGQKVKTLVDEDQDVGYKSTSWDGKDHEGKEVASGIYFYEIKTAGFEKIKKMVLLK